MPALLEINIVDTELLVHLDNLPVKVRRVLTAKMENIFDTLREKLFQNVPGKYLDPSFIKTGVEQQGTTTTIGYIEGEDKPGVYSIFPSKAKVLRFTSKSGDLVHTKHVFNHPYLKSAPHLAKLLEENKAWIEDQLYDSVIEAL